MRYILSAVTLVIALVLLALGIAQRTVWAPPDTTTAQVQTAVETPVLVIDGASLHANNGRQTIRITSDGPITAVVGRAHDVAGWIGDASYSTTVASGDEQGLGLETVTGAEASVPSIADSDLWAQVHRGEGRVQFTLDAPADYSIAIVSDGTAPAPSDVRIDWPYTGTMPLFGPLIVAGLVFLALSLLFLLLALRRHRRRRGPQRASAVSPRRRDRKALERSTKRGLPIAPPNDELTPAPSPARGELDAADGVIAPETPEATPGEDAPRASDARAERRAAPHRSLVQRFRALGIAVPALAVTVALTGCGAQYWPDLSEPTPTPTGTPQPTSLEETLPDPAVTARQFNRILDATRQTVEQADAERNAELAATRLTGPVLAARQANYQARGVDGAVAPSPGIPNGDVQLVLPQQTEQWPRAVLAVVGWEDSSLAQSALMFVQDDARSPYRIEYQYTLESGITLPVVASTEIGAASLPGNTPLLVQQPDAVTPAYADVMLNGDASASAPLFVAEGDTLRSSFGKPYKDDMPAKPEYALSNIAWSNAQDDTNPIVLVTNDGGAIVASSFTESLTLTPKESGVTIQASGATAALAGATESSTGISSTFGMQVLFYVPGGNAPEGSQIQVLGYNQDLLSASQVAG